MYRIIRDTKHCIGETIQHSLSLREARLYLKEIASINDYKYLQFTTTGDYEAYAVTNKDHARTFYIIKE